MTDCKLKSVAKVRKYARKKAFDDNRQLMRLAKTSSRDAIENSRASGIAIFYLKDGELIKEEPDRRVEVVKKANKAVKKSFDLREYLCQG